MQVKGKAQEATDFFKDTGFHCILWTRLDLLPKKVQKKQHYLLEGFPVVLFSNVVLDYFVVF